jgi:flagellar motor switch protein FliN
MVKNEKDSDISDIMSEDMDIPVSGALPPDYEEQKNPSEPSLKDLSEEKTATNANNDIELITDILLELQVELGRTKKSIKDILNFGIGTVVELDKLAGEQVDILANGKYLAKGEVVVVDENYAVRVTEISSKKNVDKDDQ